LKPSLIAAGNNSVAKKANLENNGRTIWFAALMDFFQIKKVASLFLQLIPGCLVLILLSLLLTRTQQFRSLAIPIALLGVFVMLLASTPIVSNAIVNSLEDQLKVMTEPPADTTLFVTLGNYANNMVERPSNTKMSAISLSRVTETIRLWEQHRAAKLFFGGSSRFAMRDYAIENGVEAKNIFVDHSVRDTIDEISAAIKLSKLLQAEGGTVIVSSATHLPRARLIVNNAQFRQDFFAPAVVI